MTTHLHLVTHDSNKRTCKECGKTLNLFEGYRHPTLGPHFLLCKGCFESIEKSVERWGRFVLWNSFNPNAPDPTYIDNYPFPHEENIMQQKKIKHYWHFHIVIV